MSSLKMRGLWVNDVFFFFFFFFLFCFIIWAATWQSQQCECASSEDSDQPGHPPSLIRVFTVRMRKPWVLTQWAHSEDSDQTGRMSRLIWVFSGRILIVLVLSCLCSYYHYFRMVYSPAVTLYILLRLKEKVKVKNWTTEKQLKTCIQIQHGRNL